MDLCAKHRPCIIKPWLNYTSCCRAKHLDASHQGPAWRKTTLFSFDSSSSGKQHLASVGLWFYFSLFSSLQCVQTLHCWSQLGIPSHLHNNDFFPSCVKLSNTSTKLKIQNLTLRGHGLQSCYFLLCAAVAMKPKSLYSRCKCVVFHNQWPLTLVSLHAVKIRNENVSWARIWLLCWSQIYKRLKPNSESIMLLLKVIKMGLKCKTTTNYPLSSG